MAAACGSGQLSVVTPDTDSDWDSEGGGSAGFLPRPRLQVIHSGHFMVSSPHSDHRHRGKEPERPGALPSGSIDPTLTRLFECMSLAYSGKLVSPKWKNFKGLRLLCRDKIRLNNAIWRAWYLQYVERRKTPVCGFVTPLDGSEVEDHRKPEAVVLEGNYWKRRIEVVMKEYHKWRIYYKKRLRKPHQEGEPFQEQKSPPSWRCSEVYAGCPLLEKGRGAEEELYDLDYFLSDISDTLFTTTHGLPPAYPFPDYDYAGNADMIQPELATLQPNLDDFMDISDFFGGPRPVTFQQLPLCFQEHQCYSSLSEGTSAHPHSAVACHKNLQSHSSFGSRSDSCFPNSPLSSGFASTPFPCASSTVEHKPLSHYTSPNDSFTTRHFPPSPPLPIPRVSQNLPLPCQDLLFPPVSCLKPPYTGVATDPDTIAQAAPPPIHAEVYSQYSESSPHGDPPHVFPMPKARGRVSSTKPRRAAQEGTTRPIYSLNRPHIAAKPDSAAEMPSGGPTGPNPTTGGRSDFPGIAAPEPSSNPSALGFSPAPPSIFVSPVLCTQGSSAVLISGTPSLSCPSLLPKTERLSPTSVCGGESKSSLSVSYVQSPHSWGRTERKKVESRRITHISAEQKRRCNIKVGFDTLHSLVTTLHAPHNNKLSKATTLHKTAEYMSKLQQERAQLQEEAQRLRCQIQELNDSINLCQQQLPASGVPITRQRFQHMRQMFQSYVQTRTLQNWKFWLFSIIIRPLFESFNGMVSTASLTDLRNTTLKWLDQHCSLPVLRPTVLTSLCQLSTSTCILTDPSLIPDQAVQAVTRRDNGDSFF
ncbi:carbohydrate-responsive element-binding protein isoform X1 [Ascaphus truei]|uniref:carbohydrate-responsive element-binding protein isoform X1 n=1 Tax=Ascaphus truei TaxID=8439 RepID=UPI003F598589